jgi:hypothetical protein
MAYTSKGPGRRTPPPSATNFAPPATSQGTGKTVNITRFLGIAVLALLAGAALFFLGGDFRTETLTFDRDALDTKPAPLAESVFTEQRTIELRAGNGLAVDFTVRYRGEVAQSSKLTLPKWHKLDEWVGNHPARDQEIATLKAAFPNLATEWSAPPAMTPVFDIIVDTSSGVNPALRDMIADRVERIGINQAVKAGLGVEVFGFRFGSSDFLDYQSTGIARGSKNLSGVTSAVASVTRPEAGKASTSLAAGLFNALGKNQGKRFRTAVIFSDGLQSGHGADFYKHPPTDPKAFQKLLETLEATGKVPCPDLSGVWVYWYSPKDAAHASQIRSSLEFWKWALGKRGAEVKEIEY